MAPAAAIASTVDAWQASGADRVDPVRFAHLAALARRAQAHGGPVQAVLQPRLAALVADYAARVAQASAAMPEARPVAAAPVATPAGALSPSPSTASPASPVRALWQRLDAGSSAAAAGLPGAAPPVGRIELKALQQFRGSWTQLKVDQQLRRSHAQAPEQAGPLNSHRLALRTLQALRTLSPAYLQRFLSQMDTLLWLQAANAAAEAAATAAPRTERTRKRRTAR